MKLTLTDQVSDDMRKAIIGPLARFNDARVGRSSDYRPLAVLILHPETDEILGGLWGATSYSYLHVDLLFVPEIQRRSGLGRQVLTMAEEEALRRGCHGVWLDTYSFQAKGFYEHLGYSVFGMIEDYPPNHSRIFLKKSISKFA